MPFGLRVSTSGGVTFDWRADNDDFSRSWKQQLSEIAAAG
jgi:hypothetical protein